MIHFKHHNLFIWVSAALIALSVNMSDRVWADSHRNELDIEDVVWKSGLSSPPCLVSAERFDGRISVKGYTASQPDSCGENLPPGEGETTSSSNGTKPQPHRNRFAAYEGTQTCLACHTEEAREAHASVHYQWKGDAYQAIGIDDFEAGKLGGINDFCIYPDINWIGKLTTVDGNQVDGGCAKCHAGLGEKPTTDQTRAQLENVDCLICHSDLYKRKVEKIDGKFRFVPDTENMTVSLYEAAVALDTPSKDSCLNCHTKAGGGNNFKRGDIEEAHRDPERSFDVHMASREKGGAGLSCLDCHKASNHRIAGRGTDLRPRESEDEVSCTKCHTDRPHHQTDLDRHTGRMNCTVCHIPFFAKEAPTDMDRDWSEPGDFLPEKGLYEPHHAKGTRVVPEYRFFNGTSYFYQFGDPATPGESGRVVMSAPLGDIRDPGAKIHAFKHHLATQPADAQSGRLLPLKIGKFFESGQIDSQNVQESAVRLGAEAVGWGYQGHTFVETERYMGLYHEVAPKSEALSCNDCHGGNRMDFDSLGYRPDSTRNGSPLCASCHEDESDEWTGEEYFRKIHRKHVDDKDLDCSSCHNFTAAR